MVGMYLSGRLLLWHSCLRGELPLAAPFDGLVHVIAFRLMMFFSCCCLPPFAGCYGIPPGPTALLGPGPLDFYLDCKVGAALLGAAIGDWTIVVTFPVVSYPAPSNCLFVVGLGLSYSYIICITF